MEVSDTEARGVEEEEEEEGERIGPEGVELLGRRRTVFPLIVFPLEVLCKSDTQSNVYI